MLKKLKQKFAVVKIRKILLSILSLMFIAGGISSSSTAKAVGQSFDPGGVVVTNNIDTEGYSGNWDTNSNFIRVTNDSNSSFHIRLNISLQTPSQLTLGSDSIKFPDGSLHTIVGTGGSISMDGKQGCSSFDGSKFITIPIISPILGYPSQDVLRCTGTAGGGTDTYKDENKTVVAGASLTTITFDIPQGAFNALGMTAADKSTYKIDVWPSLRILYGIGSTAEDYMSVPAANQVVFVQLYPAGTGATVLASDPKPSTVPAYQAASGASSVTKGDPILGFINKIIVALLGFVNEVVYFLFYWLIAPLIQAMLSIHTYQDQFVNIIYPGWEVVRNVCNILFIVAIIAIGMATLFRIESYQFRHLLVQLIIAALLVNFSLVIGQAILALADTVQNQFLPNNVEVIRGLARDLMVVNTRDATWNLTATQLGSFSYTVTFFFWVALALGSFVVFAAIAVFLLIRIVALWVLLMLSPVAYVAGILPATASARGAWWSNFLKYAFFTPVIAFFLNMAAVISNSARNSPVMQQISSTDFKDSTMPGMSAFVFKVASNMILLVFLMLAIRVAESFGVYGGKVLSEIGTNATLKPFRLIGGATGGAAGAGLGYLGKKKTEASLAWSEPDAHGKVSLPRKLLFTALNPKTAFKGYQHQRDEKRKMVESVAEGRAFDIARSSAIIGGGPPSEEGEEKQDHLVGDYKKNNPYRTTDQIKHHFKEIDEQSATRLEKQVAYEATIMQAAENKDMNDLLMSQGFSADRDGYLMFLDEMVKSGKLSEGRAARLAEKITGSAFANQEYWYGWGSKNGHLIKLEKKKVKDEASPTGYRWELVGIGKESEVQYNGMLQEQTDKFKKKEAQDIARNLHHSAVRDLNADGSAKGLSEIGGDMVMNADDRLYAQVDRANAEQVNAFINVIGSDQAKKQVAKSIINQKAKENITISQQEAESEAAKKIKEFSTKYLRYDVDTKVKLKKEKDDPVEQMTKVDKLDSDFRTISKNDREEVQKHLRTTIQSPGVYKFNLPDDLAGHFASHPESLTRIQNSAVQQLSGNLTSYLQPKDLIERGILEKTTTINQSDLTGAQRQIALSIRKVITSNPTFELKSETMQSKLKDAVVAELKETNAFKDYDDEKRKQIADQILAPTKK